MIDNGLRENLPPDRSTTGTAGLIQGFLTASRYSPTNPALEVAGQAYSYAELYSLAAPVAATLQKQIDPQERLVATFAGRSVHAFTALAAILMSGRGYVPLHPDFPADKTHKMLVSSGCETIIVESGLVDQFLSIVGDAASNYLLIVPDLIDQPRPDELRPGQKLISASELVESSEWRPVTTLDQDLAYLLFTSGSTGDPKGVPITQGNVSAFLGNIESLFQFSSQDRFSQMFELVFDLSVFDIFVAWNAGACICCPSAKEMLALKRYIVDANISVWFSVPSVAHLMQRRRPLGIEAFPSLRFSLFCGEALPVDLAAQWRSAAPHSALANLYGPTELTVACTAYICEPGANLVEQENGLVPIGEPFENLQIRIVSENDEDVEPGSSGELVVAGAQCFQGYLNAPDKTRAALLNHDGTGAVYYRTGDIVRVDSNNHNLHFLGRTDGQIQVRGVRVELSEIESVLRSAIQGFRVVALGWPRDAELVETTIGFVECEQLDASAVVAKMREELPHVLVPSRLIPVGEFPLNSNGKIDRNALLARYAAIVES